MTALGPTTQPRAASLRPSLHTARRTPQPNRQQSAACFFACCESTCEHLAATYTALHPHRTVSAWATSVIYPLVVSLCISLQPIAIENSYFRQPFLHPDTNILVKPPLHDSTDLQASTVMSKRTSTMASNGDTKKPEPASCPYLPRLLSLRRGKHHVLTMPPSLQHTTSRKSSSPLRPDTSR